jgi:hypothetical protein
MIKGVIMTLYKKIILSILGFGIISGAAFNSVSKSPQTQGANKVFENG